MIIRTAGNDSTVFVIVTDNGIGIPPELLNRIFEPFFTTKDVGKGTGLGLSTAYGIIKQSRGDIQVQTRGEQGTVFTISLPRAREPRPAPAPLTGGRCRGGAETILLVEDDDHARDMVEQVLLRLGYDVLTAAERERGDRYLPRYQRKDLAADHRRRHGAGSGPQVYARVAALVPEIAVLFLSGYTGRDRPGERGAPGRRRLPAEAVHAEGAGVAGARGARRGLRKPAAG